MSAAEPKKGLGCRRYEKKPFMKPRRKETSPSSVRPFPKLPEPYCGVDVNFCKNPPRMIAIANFENDIPGAEMPEDDEPAKN
jgi:hypothetical protein